MSKIQLSRINFTPTMRCNLKCKLCGVLVPHYECKPHMSDEEFKETLDRVFQVVDYVQQIQFTGGEPLLHLSLEMYIEECFQYQEQFDELWIFSNCAVPIRTTMMETIIRHRDRIVIHCSDYGVRPEIAEKNIKLLQENNVNYKYLKYYGDSQYCDGWVDNGDFIAHNRTDKENKEIFANCNQVKSGGFWYVRNGQMHWCGRSIRGTEVGRIPLKEKDYLDLFEDISIEEKRDKFLELINTDMILACDYCNGNYGTTDKSKRVPAGEQME